ncbi:unnamed protein product [Cyclocybe aegerita]|uniref:AN1-type domain-containing protein n=1 Tax=Cyclocybe aegerita TaxID=1973307 RepID=A0A8S0VV29_CYCAE|nr:unnamed protein product [Cyclocybe aegerita]
MASSSSPAPEHDAQLLAIGKQCSHPSCLLVDFLPFKCQHCQLSFCQEHFKVDGHQCDKYDESKHNRVAPNCPLCNTPVAVRQGQDPNVRMDYHLEKECSVVTGKVNSGSTPRCSRGACNKVLFSPIRCDQCRLQFCVAHRFPGDHTCNPVSPASLRPNIPNLANLNASAKNINAKASAAGSAALGAVKKSIASASSSSSKPPAAKPPVASSSSTKPIKPALPFSKMDRRARAERESKLKAMRARAQKGLLTEDEKAILAAEEAASKDNKDCVIM